jgi:transposase
MLITSAPKRKKLNKKEVAEMYYTGIDLHKKTSYITTVDEKGCIVNKANLLNVEELILDYFFTLKTETRIVIESMGSWYWLYDLLTGNGFDVVISNPAKTKAISSAKIKNDKVDSRMLAQLLRSDLIPTVYVSSLETRKLKELLRQRARLVRDRTRMKNRVQSVLRKNNKSFPFSDLFGANGLRYLQKLYLPDYYRQEVDIYLCLYQKLQDQIKPLTKVIVQMAKDHHIARLLMTIPGIGPIVAMTILAELEDISRFPSYRNLASYCGLVPSLDASGGKEKTGRITKQGSPHLRTALVEAAHTIPRMRKSKLNLYFRRRIVRAGYRKAIVATAHKILQIVYYVLKNQTPYREEHPICA